MLISNSSKASRPLEPLSTPVWTGARLVAVAAILLLGTTCTTGCSGAEEKEDDAGEAATASGSATPSGEGARAGESDVEGSPEKCLGKVTPPRGAGGRQFLQEPAVDANRPIEEVVAEAKEKLLQRLCQGYRCETLASDISTWKIQRAGAYRCSKAVIPKSTYDRWVESNKRAVEQKLNTAAENLVKAVDSGPDGTLTLGLATVQDRRALGTARARWLYDKMQESIDNAGARTVPIRTAFQTASLPEGVDGQVDGRVYSRRGKEALLEVTWKLTVGDAVVAAESVSFAEVLSPDVDDKAFLPDAPEGNDQVQLHFDFEPGKGVCHGESLQLWVETSRDLYVRVVNLFGDDQGTVIYPRKGGDGEIPAGRPVSLGKFRALQSDDGKVEYWMVLAAPSLDELGKFADANRACELPRSVVTDLKEGEGLTDAVEKRLSVQSYPILREPDRCREIEVDPKEIERLEQAMARMPTCWSNR